MLKQILFLAQLLTQNNAAITTVLMRHAEPDPNTNNLGTPGIHRASYVPEIIIELGKIYKDSGLNLQQTTLAAPFPGDIKELPRGPFTQTDTANPYNTLLVARFGEQSPIFPMKSHQINNTLFTGYLNTSRNIVPFLTNNEQSPPYTQMNCSNPDVQNYFKNTHPLIVVWEHKKLQTEMMPQIWGIENKNSMDGRYDLFYVLNDTQTNRTLDTYTLCFYFNDAPQTKVCGDGDPADKNVAFVRNFYSSKNPEQVPVFAGIKNTEAITLFQKSTNDLSNTNDLPEPSIDIHKIAGL